MEMKGSIDPKQKMDFNRIILESRLLLNELKTESEVKDVKPLTQSEEVKGLFELTEEVGESEDEEGVKNIS